jgi:hypothetical protein
MASLFPSNFRMFGLPGFLNGIAQAQVRHQIPGRWDLQRSGHMNRVKNRHPYQSTPYSLACLCSERMERHRQDERRSRTATVPSVEILGLVVEREQWAEEETGG